MATSGATGEPFVAAYAMAGATKKLPTLAKKTKTARARSCRTSPFVVPSLQKKRLPIVPSAMPRRYAPRSTPTSTTTTTMVARGGTRRVGSLSLDIS